MTTETTKQQTLATPVDEQPACSRKLEAAQPAQVKSLQQAKVGQLGALRVQLGFIGEHNLAEALADFSDWRLAGNDDHRDTAQAKRVAQTFSGTG